METESVIDRPQSGRPGVSEEAIVNVQDNFQRSPRKSVCPASRDLQLSKSTAHKVVFSHDT